MRPILLGLAVAPLMALAALSPPEMVEPPAQSVSLKPEQCLVLYVHVQAALSEMEGLASVMRAGDTQGYLDHTDGALHDAAAAWVATVPPLILAFDDHNAKLRAFAVELEKCAKEQ